MDFIIDVGRTLARPWKEDISPKTAIIVVILFIIIVWWVFDTLNIFSKMQLDIEELIK